MEIFIQKVKISKMAYIPYGAVEEEAKDFYLNKGYTVERRGLSGEPDFFVFNKNKSFWVEVKQEKECLRPSQREWIKINEDEKVIIHKIVYDRGFEVDLEAKML